MIYNDRHGMGLHNALQCTSHIFRTLYSGLYPATLNRARVSFDLSGLVQKLDWTAEQQSLADSLHGLWFATGASTTGSS